MATISDEYVRDVASSRLLGDTISHDANEKLKAMAQEIITARAYIPKLKEEIERLGRVAQYQTTLGEKHLQTARVYAEQQAKMIDDARKLKAKLASAIDIADDRAMELLDKDDEIRELKGRLAQRDYTIDEISRRFMDDEEALRWIWAFMYWKAPPVRMEFMTTTNLYSGHTDQIRQILAAVGLPAPQEEEK